jgi:branched-chain amino acid transport system substrate-binding protein
MLTRRFGRALAAASIAAVAFTFGAQAQAPQGKPIVIGQTLALTGPLGQTGMVHKIVGEIMIEDLNKSGGLLGRPVEWKLYDDESKGATARTQYERLLTVDKVDLILGPYATEGILAAMTVAQRYKKLFIQNTLGIPHLATYEGQFSALTIGAEPQNTFPPKVLQAYAEAGFVPKSVAIITSKFASAQFNSKGMEALATARNIPHIYLEYDFGTRDFGAIAARVKEFNPDFVWTGVLGVEGHQILEAYGKLGYKPKAHLYLYPSPSLAQVPGAEGGISQTSLEDQPPYTDDPLIKHYAEEFHARAAKANLPYPFIDSQAGNSFNGWQILIAAVKATNSLDDAKLIAWLEKNEVSTIAAKRDFKGKFHTSSVDTTQLRQVQNGKWIVVWPREKALATSKLVAAAAK